tara:strand:+ start:5187 stop:5468 length:282 start_codon:yes stop_codon:yes gene_type:complete
MEDFDHPTVKRVLDSFDDGDKLIVLHGFSEALVGISEKFGEEPRLVYDKNKIIEILMEEDELSEEEAIEHFYYNIIGTYMGEGTPTFTTDYRG